MMNFLKEFVKSFIWINVGLNGIRVMDPLGSEVGLIVIRDINHDRDILG